MKKIIKYILLLILLANVMSPINAQKKHKKSNKKTIVSKKNNKKVKTKKSKKKNVKAKKTSNSLINTISLTKMESKNENEETKKNKYDTIPEKVITILSAFKPQLKNVAKIGFINASVQEDTTSLLVDYNVPSQNLSFQYKPISLVPRVYKIDSLSRIRNNGNIKLGYGNFYHYLINLNYNLIDTNQNIHSFNIYNESINGAHHLQNHKTFGVNYFGDINIDKYNRISTQIFLKQNNNYRYGLIPDSTHYPNANFEQNYTHYGISMVLNNDDITYKKLKIKPILKFEHFDGIKNYGNNYFEFQNPLIYNIKNDVNLNFNITYSYNQLNGINNAKTSNSLFKLEPIIQLNKYNSVFNIGVSPTLENSEYHLYPIVSFKRKLNDTNYVIIAEWKTENINNQYSTLAFINPWIDAPSQIKMTSNDKKIIEMKINASNKFNYGFAFSFNNYKNLLLFDRLIDPNYLKNGLYYKTIFERNASTIEFDANLKYQFSDKILVKNTLKYIQFNTLQENLKPWGILPLELESNLNWILNEKLSIDGTLKYWSGATISNQNNTPTDLNNNLILNAGLNYKLNAKWTTWLRGENLFDKPYERWSNYPSLGVQLMGGIVYSFSK